MERLERCVIWGDDPETRRRLGAGAPGASGHALQGTAAEAAVPMSCAGRRAGRPRPAVLALAAALLACGAFAAGAGELGRDGLVPSPGIPRVDAASRIAGHGFTLVAGSIERSTRFGPPRFDNTDTFVMTLVLQDIGLAPRAARRRP